MLHTADCCKLNTSSVQPNLHLFRCLCICMISQPLLAHTFSCGPSTTCMLRQTQTPVDSECLVPLECLRQSRSAVQVNIELLTIDKRSFTTDEGNSLLTLFGENSEGSAQYRAEVTLIASRLATVFASLKVCQHSMVAITSEVERLSG